MLGGIVKSCFERTSKKQGLEGLINLEHSFATIPLPGIDVPFCKYLLTEWVLE
jgi:fatty acid synthase subunit alpha